MLREAAQRRHMERKAALLQRRHSSGAAAAAQTKAVLCALGLICCCSALVMGLHMAHIAYGRVALQEQASSAGSATVNPAAAAMHVAWLTQRLSAQQEHVWQLEAASTARQERSELEEAMVPDGMSLLQDIAGIEGRTRDGKGPPRLELQNSGMQRHGQHDDLLVVLAVSNATHARLQATQLLWQVCALPPPLRRVEEFARCMPCDRGLQCSM